LLSDETEPATSSDDSANPAAAAAAGDDDNNGHSSLMLAENMDTQQAEQKLRAKRDLDADDIRELFNSRNVPADDYYVPGISSSHELTNLEEAQLSPKDRTSAAHCTGG